MAGIPMEDWMRTRVSAKPTIHVINDTDGSAELKSPPNVPTHNGTLLIDRLQTPEWAQTAPGAGSEVTEAVHGKEVVHGKWGNQVAALLPAKGDAIIVNDPENEMGFQRIETQGDRSNDACLKAPDTVTSLSVKIPSEDKLADLSVEMLDANSKMSSSLALEREQLEKRKRQVDTANAVAVMNTRLSQLGLLKLPQKTTPTAQSRQENSTTPSPPNRPEASPMNNNNGLTLPSPTLAKSLSSSAFKSSGIPAPKALTKESTVYVKDTSGETGDSIGTPPKSVKSNDGNPRSTLFTSVRSSNGLPTTEVTDGISSSDEDAEKFTDDLVNQALNVLNSQEPPMPSPVDEQVSASLSMHIHGYGSQTRQHVGDSVDSEDRPNDSPTLEVDASLSSFTMGFTASSQPQEDKEIMQRSVTMDASVASSLSAFTAGYSGDVKIDAESPSDVSINQSMSAFTTGYSAAVVSPANVPEHVDRIPVDVSLSNFTSGYGAKDDTSVTQEAVRPPSVASANDTTHVTALEALGNLYQPLEDAAMALEKELATRANQDPKVLEIRELIEELRSAITDLATPS
ncbi:hypothetical protein PR003_g17846 [Phytophthora rubi]|uniref:Uncharacterized protein n=1 Tax=Phytophthora rubi TaxID=129364 RepID=A0A6A4ECN6_9STRA|nr:hypothetical protein PR001_g16592 [Phytophthora rubi]KAE9319948.1 hypothetical protein PR003_g17846 [Phytophthora rubi]